MHKLWPHSIKKSQVGGSKKRQQQSQKDGSAAGGGGIADGNTTKLEKPTSSMSEDGQSTIAEGSIQSGSDANSSKTHMCLINELAKFNKV